MIVTVKATLVTGERDISVNIVFNPHAPRAQRIEIKGLPRPRTSTCYEDTVHHWRESSTLVLPMQLAVELQIAGGPPARGHASEAEHENMCDDMADQLRVALAATPWTVL